LEELLTLAEAEESAAAAEALASLLEAGPRVRLLATARSDFLGRLTELPGLGADLSSSLYLVRQPDASGLRDAIVGPARRKGFRLAPPTLVDEVAAAAERAQGGLPLLQFALSELWDARDEATKTINKSALDAIGGVEGALARHADDTIAGLLPTERTAA